MNLYLLIMGVIVLFLFSMVISNKDILSPACIMCSVFLFSSIIALINAENWNIDYSLKTTGYLVAGIGSFCSTECLVSLFVRRPKNNNTYDFKYRIIEINNKKLICLILIEIVGILLYYLEIKSVAGVSTNVLLTYRKLQTSGRTIDTSINLVVVILNRFLRATAYVSLYFFIRNIIADKKGWKKHINLLILSLYLVVGCFFNSSRGELIKIITFIIVVAYVSIMQRRLWGINISWKFIRVGAFTLVTFLPAFYWIAILINRKPKEGLLTYVSAYAGGAIQLFDLFVDSTNSFGNSNEVFSGVQSLLLRLGIIKETTSTHLEFRWLNNTTNGNIYTFFRSPLNDFGFTGMILFTCVISLFFSLFYYINIKGRKRIKDIRLIWYAYLFSWISMASIAQMANAYINIGTIVEMIFMWIIYVFYRRVKFI